MIKTEDILQTLFDPSKTIRGIGVDLESHREVKKEMTRFFLTRKEQTVPASEFLRLWTVKEALFKACPENDKLLLSDFETEDPKAMSGKAYLRGNPAFEFRYSSHRIEAGYWSYAVCQ
ncbi:MAG: 4'-phosphopantetheinyl transferase superfamily protein [Alphaproteobacteria bacterium]|nr:4'-phosphopantetheinyl transferase superfamily protein [Alphaproteobacteria bacterium]